MAIDVSVFKYYVGKKTDNNNSSIYSYSGTGSVDYTKVLVKNAGRTGYVLDLPLLYNDSSILLWYEPSTNSVRTNANFYAGGEVGAFSKSPDPIDWWNTMRYVRESSLGNTLYWVNGILNASTGGGTGDVTKVYVDGSLATRDTAISGKQTQLNGTGFVKASGTSISYDNNTYLTGITSGQVTGALGFTPYNATNPNGYITSSALSPYATLANSFKQITYQDLNVYDDFTAAKYGLTHINTPTGDFGYYLSYGTGSYGGQTFIDYSGNDLFYYRGVMNGTPRPWKQLAPINNPHFTGSAGFRYSESDNNFYNYITGTGNNPLELSGGKWTGDAAQVGIKLSTNTAGAVNILNNGNVGVEGNTAPTRPLSFSNYVGAKIALYDNGGSIEYGLGIQANTLQIYADTATDRVGIGYGRSAAFTETLTVKGDRVGIGTVTPEAQFEVYRSSAGDGIMLSSPIGTGWRNAIAWNHSKGSGVVSARIATVDDGNYGGHLVFENRTGIGTATNERMRLTTGGNIGIGTTSPETKLHIKQDINTGWSGDNDQGIAIENMYNTDNFSLLGFRGYSSDYQKNLAQIGGRFTGAGSYLYFGTSNNYAAGITNSAIVIDYNSNTSINGNAYVSGEVTAYYSSDERLKSDIKPFKALDIINQLKPVTFNWNEKAKELNSVKDDRNNFGLIAQEVEQVIPEVVHPIYDEYKSVDYVQMVPILIQAIKELHTEITVLKAR